MINLSVALVEYDVDLARKIGLELAHHGMSVTLFEDSKKLESWLIEHKCDVILLDLNVPDEDGLSIAKRLSARQNLHVILLTDCVMTENTISDFNASANTYLKKPVDLDELISVILLSVVHRRLIKPSPESSQSWQFKPIVSRLITPNGETIKLTRSESRFLELLTLAKNNHLTRMELETALWRLSDIHTARRLEVLVCRLRSKLLNYDLIQTYRGEGYALMASLLP